ncbi:nucleotide exchange factor GrpE [Candidatus Sumerlaeota bacterium]|nr:nucleotide exchange factor GrpE [Candidatus Sumerlaeota bacterium]
MSTKLLARKFPLPHESGETKEELQSETLDNNKDIVSIVSELMAEKESFLQLAMKLKYRRDAATNEELERLVKSLLPFLDGLEHVLKIARMHPPSPEVNNWLKTIESLYFRITNILEKHGLTAVESVGKPVDLNYHEVVEYIPSKESPDNTVIAERQKGYIFRGKVIRDAKVVVSYKEGSE